jgi:isopropylmalate/homocitrate/citramalate synthase
MLSNSYPKCIHSLNKWLQGCQKRQDIYNRIKPQLFDVTLRDGLQTIPQEQHQQWTTQEKKNTYYQIKFNHNPENIEIGSLANPKLLPIFSDSLHLYKEIDEEFHNISNKPDEKMYILIPSLNMLKKALEHNVTNFSFITSVSNAFQKKNTNKSLKEKKMELQEMCFELEKNAFQNRNHKMTNNKLKLYISCINDCPLTGLIDNDFIVHEILNYGNNLRFDELCLSDTCGTLKFEDFEYIIDNCLYFGLPASKLSLHLHISEDNFMNTKQIVNYAFDKNINKFDVSMIKSGGCSITIKNDKCKNNMTYELFYRFLVEYIEKKIEKEN